MSRGGGGGGGMSRGGGGGSWPSGGVGGGGGSGMNRGGGGQPARKFDVPNRVTDAQGVPNDPGRPVTVPPAKNMFEMPPNQGARDTQDKLEEQKLAAAEQRRIEREAEEAERAAAEKIAAQERQAQMEIAQIRAEIERLRAIDAEQARQQERELERRERQLMRDRERWEDERREREDDRRRRQARAANPPAPPPAPAAPRVARAPKAPKPPKPEAPKPRELTAAELDATLEDLASDDVERQQVALGKLGLAIADDAQRAKVTAALLPHVDSANPKLAAPATLALAVWADAERAPRVVKLLDSKQVDVRRAAFRTLAVLKPKDTAEAIAARLSVPSDRNLAADALVALGAEGEVAASARADHDELWVRSAVIDILEAIGGKTSRATLNRLADGDPESFVRNKASDALRNLGG